MPDILHRILARKAEEVAERKRHRSLDDLVAMIDGLEPTRGFAKAIDTKLHAGQPAVIAEIKKASPSKGLIRADFNPAEIARSYEQGGAACLSVLTDADFFQGHEDFVREARDACALPILRKDFIVDQYQVYEARIIGADCILLIVAAFADKAGDDVVHDEDALRDLATLAIELGMDVLVEVHNEDELNVALNLTVPFLIGVNNRNLRTFETSLGTSLHLKEIVGEATIVAESGIHNREDVKMLRDKGIDCFLVGEAFMRAADPGAELRKLFGAPSVPPRH